MSPEKLSPQQWARLEAELRQGLLAHGFADNQRWTLVWIKTLIGRLFHVGYTVEGAWKLMRRHGWSCQVPVRRAVERDEDAIEVWKSEVAADKSTARDLGAYICFEDETRPITLTEFRERVQAQPDLFDENEWVGCGCFAD